LRQKVSTARLTFSWQGHLAIEPASTFALHNKGVALTKLNCHDEALAAFDAALALNPDFPNALYNKARVYALQGKVEFALESLDKAIQLSPDKYRELTKTNTDFDSIRDDPRFKALITSKWRVWLNNLTSLL
jgi:tetratricopeptide (TPR) repeat protein